MKLHEREAVTQEARLKIHGQLAKYQERFNLTDVEMLQILVSYQALILKYALRVERHGDANKEAGLAPENFLEDEDGGQTQI